MNRINQDTGTRYVWSEVFQLPYLLPMWVLYLTIDVVKDRTEHDELNQVNFGESGFIDVVV